MIIKQKNLSMYKILIASTILILLLYLNNNSTSAQNNNNLIISTEILKTKSENIDVKNLQKSLSNLGLYISVNGLTGYYGNNTNTAIKAIQKYSSIKINGITGSDTISAINKLLKTNNNQQRTILKKYQNEFLKDIEKTSNVSISSKKINFVGTEFTNKSSRYGFIPKIIVNHITGTNSFYSTHLWFTKSYNNTNSAHFVIDRNGDIYQYVHMKYSAWANGIKDGKLKYVTSNYIKNMGYNVNSQSISIEHVGTNGSLTESQFESSVWLHKYIRRHVEETYGYTIPFNRTHIVGHYEIDPINRAYCPGPQFPWNRLMDRLSN